MFNISHLYAFPCIVKSWIYANGTKIRLLISSSRISKVLNDNFLLLEGGSGGWGRRDPLPYQQSYKGKIQVWELSIDCCPKEFKLRDF